MSDDMTQRLLAMMTKSGGSNGSPTEAMLSELFGDDPRAGLIAQYLSKSQTNAGEEDLALDAEDDLLEQVEESDYDPLPAEHASAANEHRLPRLLHDLEELSAKNEELKEWIDTLAAALGACHRCWGDHDACRICGGRGQPGWRLPERKLFNELIAPAIRRWRRQLQTRHRPVARDEAERSGVDKDQFDTKRMKP